MIIVKPAAKQPLAVTLALAFFASVPMSVWSQTQAAATRAGSGIGLSGAVGSMGAMPLNASGMTAPVAPLNLALNAPALVAAAVSPTLKVMALPVAAGTSLGAAPRPVAGAVPEGSAKQNMIAMAAAVGDASSSDSSARLGRMFDSAQARADVILLPDGGWYAGLNYILSQRNYITVRDGALAALFRARAAGRRRLSLVVERGRKEGWSEALLLNPQDPRAEAGIRRFLLRISDLQNTTHLDSVAVRSAGPLSGRAMRSRAILPKGGWYAGLNIYLSQDRYLTVEAVVMAALDRAAAAGDDVLVLKIDRTRTEGYSEILLLDPRKPEEARSGLRLFLRGISNLQNTTHLDSVSISRPVRRR